MPSQAEIEEKFWKTLKSDRTVMLGVAGSDGGAAQPMTAQLQGEGRGPIWFFSAKDVDLVREIGGGRPGVAYFAAKDHGLFASIEGDLVPDNDRATIDRLWNRFVAAWYEGGEDDPKLQLLRFEPRHAQVWLNENSLFAGIKLLLGSDPKKDYAGKTAELTLG